MSLSHRERVITALKHQEPDRVPFDLGSTVNSSINIVEYQKLKLILELRLRIPSSINGNK